MQHKLIGRGLNGWHSSGLDHGNRCSSSGGTLEGYLAEAEDGCLIYDADGADAGAFASFICSGPMSDFTLKLGEVKKFGERTTLARMLPGLGGAYRTIGAAALQATNQEEKLGSLDYVAVDIWLTMLKEKVSGVRFGKVISHAIVWD